MRQEWLLPSQINEVSEGSAEETKEAVNCELGLLESMIAKVDDLRNNTLYSSDAQRRFQGYEEFRRHAVGKVITVETEKKGRQSFRVSQANSDFAMTNGNLATPLSPVGYLCRQAYLGYEGTSSLWGDYAVVEVRTLSRYYGQEAEDNIFNYKSMERKVFPDDYSTDENIFLVSDLTRSLKNWFNKSRAKPEAQEGNLADDLEPEVNNDFDTFDQFDSFDSFDVVSGFDVAVDDESNDEEYLTVEAMEDDVVDDYYGLSNYFYLNPTQEQLDVMTGSVSAGPMLIEGIAGSGKTCAALGRAKTLCDAALGADDQVIESTTFFSQESSVGFVRTGELVQYLKATCLELGLSHLPISEYKELQHDLQKLRDIEQRPVRKAEEGRVAKPKYQFVRSLDYDHAPESTMNWLKMVDCHVAQVIAIQLEMATSKILLPSGLHYTAQFSEVDAQALVTLYRNEYLKASGALAEHIQQNSTTFQNDDIIKHIDDVLSRLDQQLLDTKNDWVSLGEGNWKVVHNRKQALELLRDAQACFIRNSRREKKQYFVISTQADLNNLINNSEFVKDQHGNVVDMINIDEKWSQCVADKENKSAGIADFSCQIQEKKIAVSLVEEDDIEFYALNQELLVRLGNQIKVAISTNPFQASLERITSKDGTKGSKTSVGKELRRRLRQALFSKLHFADIYAAALKLANEIGEDVGLAYERISNKQLAEHDIDVILAMAHIMTRSADVKKIKNLPPRLGKPTYYRSVFVDEVQDFNEIQIFLMGAQAHPEYNAVTMVGDMQQQLFSGKVKNINGCFPYQGQIEAVLLEENKRQERQPQLVATSHLFRLLVQNDNRILSYIDYDVLEAQSKTGKAKLFFNQRFNQVDETILDIIRNQPRGRTIAVVCPTQDMAKELELRLRGVLASEDFRQSYVAERVDLSKKYLIHFSCPKNIKGLEFDTVIVAGLEAVDWKQAEQRNSIYVAVSRPRKQLMVMGESESLPDHVLDCLVTS